MHTHLIRDDRIRLSSLLRAGHSQSECAGQLDTTPSAISYELKRNRDPDGIYRASNAQKKTEARRKRAKEPSRKIQNNSGLERYIVKAIKQRRWSPEQIAGRLKKAFGHTVVCHETIYAWIYTERPELKMYLRCKKGKYRRKRGTKQREKAREQAKKTRIDKRPSVVEKRSRIGDWEGDTIVGKKQRGAVAVFVERRTGYVLAAPLASLHSVPMREQAKKLFHRIAKDKRHTLTLDNGREFSEYEFIERDTEFDIYFANAYHSWERGTSENTNGLLREFFPKGIPLDNITDKKTKRAVSLLNHRPRKRLGYLTPHEVFYEKSDVEFQVRM